jgi:hypothetical protein
MWGDLTQLILNESDLRDECLIRITGNWMLVHIGNSAFVKSNMDAIGNNFPPGVESVPDYQKLCNVVSSSQQCNLFFLFGCFVIFPSVLKMRSPAHVLNRSCRHAFSTYTYQCCTTTPVPTTHLRLIDVHASYVRADIQKRGWHDWQKLYCLPWA